jgi:hypothetical protein
VSSLTKRALDSIDKYFEEPDQPTDKWIEELEENAKKAGRPAGSLVCSDETGWFNFDPERGTFMTDYTFTIDQLQSLINHMRKHAK